MHAAPAVNIQSRSKNLQIIAPANAVQRRTDHPLLNNQIKVGKDSVHKTKNEEQRRAKETNVRTYYTLILEIERIFPNTVQYNTEQQYIFTHPASFCTR